MGVRQDLDDDSCVHGKYNCQACEIRTLKKVIEEYRQEAEDMRKTLSFYADENNHKPTYVVSDYRRFISKVAVDKGQLARETLEAIKKV